MLQLVTTEFERLNITNDTQLEREENSNNHKLSIRNLCKRENSLILQQDISNGKERFPIRVVNAFDDSVISTQFIYTTRIADTSALLKSRKCWLSEACLCDDLCSTGRCPCKSINYKKSGRAPIEKLMEVIYECNAGCQCSLQCHNRVAQKGAKYPVEIFRTSNKGWGVRAKITILKGSFIGEYTGELRKDGDGCGEYLFETKVGETSCTIDASSYGNFTRFINHSCTANLHAASVVWENMSEPFVHICFFALKNICEGEELTVDYGPEWWKENIVSFPCKCNSHNCQFDESKRANILADKTKRNRDRRETAEKAEVTY